jgi:sentrin-specific protease 1
VAGIEIRKKDIECMRDGERLNDEVINFYMGLMQQRELKVNPKKPRCHFFNTFFYKALTSDTREYNYKNVCKWTAVKKLGGYSILDCEEVVVPIHRGEGDNAHWVLVVINIASKSLEFFDSLGGNDQGARAHLAQYLSDEYMHKREQTVDTSWWERDIQADVPQQQNTIDCGVFMLSFAKALVSSTYEIKWQTWGGHTSHLLRSMGRNLRMCTRVKA